MFRWISLIVVVSTVGISGYSRYRARQQGASIRRVDESKIFIALRLLVAVPLFGSIFAYLINPVWLDWARMDLPAWVRWVGVAAGFATIPLALWVFSSLGSNVSETVLTRSGQQLVTEGPYHWVRHPLYATGVLLLISVALMSSNWLILLLTVLSVTLVVSIVIPQEEAALIDRFGARYRSYMEGTGRLLPRLNPTSRIQ